MHKKIFVYVFFTVLAVQKLSAQSAMDSVKATIQQLFTGMKNADSAAVKNCFADSAIMQTIAKNKEGKEFIKTVLVDLFAAQIQSIEKGAADERISFETININGSLAIVWTPYQFYWKGQFSHCGINSFQLVRINQQWKIQYLIDTRRKDNCPN